jgi:hypothetical protein
MGEEAGPDSDMIRGQVRDKYRAVALDPGHAFGFHAGRALAAGLGYDARGRRAARPGSRVLRRCQQPLLAAPVRTG